MKKFLTILLSAFFLAANAQDVIVKQDGSTILSKVLEIGTSEIKYKKWDNLEGPTYTINIKDIQTLNYQNGTKETFENKKETVPSKSTTGFIEIQPGIGITEGYKGELGLKIGFLTKASDNFKWGLGIGAQALNYEFSEIPLVPIFMRLEYQANSNSKNSFFAHLDAGYNLNIDNFDEGSIQLNPTLGSYFGNTYIGIGYIGSILTKSGSDTYHGVNFTLGQRFGNPIAKSHHGTGMKRFMSHTKGAISIGGVLGITNVSYSDDYQHKIDGTMGSGANVNLAWTYMFNDHFDFGIGTGIGERSVLEGISNEYDSFSNTKDIVIPLFLRAEYTFFNKEKKIRPFIRADVGKLFGIDYDFGMYLQPQVGVKYKKWFASIGLESTSVDLINEYTESNFYNLHDFDNKSMLNPVLNIGIEF